VEGLLIAYYETCATYGLIVERVFQDGELYVLSRIFMIFLDRVVQYFVEICG
jgi:hypothetical protein